MMNIRLATEADKEDWNKVVEESDNGTIYHTWEWKQVIEQGLGDKAYYVIAEENNELVGIYPLFSRASLKYSKLPVLIKDYFKVVWSPHPQTWGYGGPCFIETANDDTRERMLDTVDVFVRENRRVLSLRIFPYKNEISQYLPKNDFREITWQTAYLDLSITIDELWTNLNKKHRNSIRKGRKKDLKVIEGKKESEVKEFYENVWCDLVKYVTDKAKRQMMYSPKFLSYEYFKAIWNTLVPKKMAKFYFVYYNDKIISGLISFCYKNMATYEHGASIREYLDLSPNNLLLWTAIEDAKKNGYKNMP